MSSQQDKTGIAGVDQDFVDAQLAPTSTKIAVPESPKFGGEPDPTEKHLDIGETIAEVSPIPPEPSSLMEPDYDEICIICRESSDRTSMREAVPCGHKFHEECLLLWVEGTAHSKGLCPYCNRAVWALATDAANAKSYTIKPTSIQWPQPEWTDDNDLAPPIRELKQHMDSEELLLIALGPTFSKHSATYLDICIREDPWFIRVQKTIELEMLQKDTHSHATVTWELELKYFDMRQHVIYPMEALTINTDAESKQEYEKAKKEVTKAAEKYICLGQGIDGRLQMPRYYIVGGERGLTTSIDQNVSICVSEDWPKTRPEEVINSWETPIANVKWVVDMEERSVAYPDGFDLQHDIPGIPEDRLIYWRSKQPEWVTEYTRQTYEWLKATMEWFFKKRGEKFQGRPFDRGATNLLEPCKPGGKCGYCKEEHRTGDCLLPWN